MAVDVGSLRCGDSGYYATGTTNSLAGISPHISDFEDLVAPCMDRVHSTWTESTGSFTFDPLSEVKVYLEQLNASVQSTLGCLEAPQLSELKNLVSQALPRLESTVQSEIESRLPPSPAETPEDGFRYRCRLCPTSKNQECSKRGAFKRHVTERHEAEYRYTCSLCFWYTHRRDKVHPHYRKYHGLVGRLMPGQVNSLGVRLPVPSNCAICSNAVNSYAAYFDCFASHCRVLGNIPDETSNNGSRKNSDDSGNGGGGFYGQNGLFNNFGGPGGPSNFSAYPNGNGYSGGPSNFYSRQSFGYNGYNNQCPKDIVDLHQHQSSPPRNQDPHDKRNNPYESTSEQEKSDQVEQCKNHPDHQTKHTDTQQNSPAVTTQHNSSELSPQTEDRKAHFRGSINGILGQSLPLKPGTTGIRRCRSCGHSIDDCTRCKSFGAAADRCHNCADKSCILQMPRLKMPRPADELAPPHAGPLDHNSALTLRKSHSLPTYRGDKTRMVLKSLPTSYHQGKASGRHPGERDRALQELHNYLAAVARKQGALEMPRVNRNSVSGSLPEKTATHDASEDGATTVNFVIPRLERFSSSIWRQQTIFFERNRYIAQYIKGMSSCSLCP